MSTVVCTLEGKIKLYCKGTDTVILERLAKSQLFMEKTLLLTSPGGGALIFAVFPFADCFIVAARPREL
jgi:hypothetical protein